MTCCIQPLRVAVVAPIMVRYDAISLSAKDTVRALAVDPRFHVQHYGCACDFPEIEHRLCRDVSDLLLDPFYQMADAAVFHFGIHHSLFDALLAGGPPVRVVCFHNVTPPRFVSPAEVPVIERSLRQIDILRNADEIWAVSPTNEQELLDRGFDQSRVRIIPLVVDDPSVAGLAQKPVAPVHVLSIGRIAPSKGLYDLILAVARTRLPQGTLRVTIAGNTAWSDPGYLMQLHDLIARHDLVDVVHFVGTIDDAERERLFHAAHILAIPSYHEGFCRPVAEGLRAGCVPLVYDAYNLPNMAAGLGRVVPTGDIGALAAAMADLVRTLPAAMEHPAEALLPLDRGETSVDMFTDLAHRHTASFAFEAVSAQMRDRLLRLTRDPVPVFAKPCSIGESLETSRVDASLPPAPEGAWRQRVPALLGNAIIQDDRDLQIRLALGRNPTDDERCRLLSAANPYDLQMQLADFPEVYLHPAARRSYEMAQQRRLASVPLDIQTDAPPEELDRLFRATERAWEKLGKEEPYWSVVTTNAFKMQQIEADRRQFYESGAAEVDIYLQFLKRAGAETASIRHLLEIGCGVGRMTHQFAKHFLRVTGVDISDAHIQLAGQALTERGVTNVDLHKVSSPRDYAAIQGYDAVYSFIVLQHSPPPIIVHVLAAVLGNLKPGGYAYFQVPTFIEGYNFSIESYLNQTKEEMEMHCLPQARVFQLLRNFEILEVINDGSGGDHRFESMRFFARKQHIPSSW